MPLTRLRWWTWRQARERRSPAAKADDLRLLPVVVEPTGVPAPTKPSTSAEPAWEVCTAGGDVLRVYRAIVPAEIQAALTVLVRRGGRR